MRRPAWRRPLPFSALVVLLFALGWLMPTAQPASLARPEAVPVQLPIPVITAGGVNWERINNDQDCSTVTGGPVRPFNIQDAKFLATGHDDAYDDAFCMFVNSAPFLLPGPPSTVDLTGTTVTAGPATLSGLSVTQEFFFLNTAPVVRVLANLTNPTAAPITVPVAFESNLGSDSSTAVVGSSSGDLVFNASDRWAITADSPTDPAGDPPLIHVIFGPGSPPVTPTIAGVSIVGPLCANGPTVGNWCVLYNVTVPPGATRRLMLFDQLNSTVAQAQAQAPSYDSNPAQGSEFLSGLTPQQLLEIVNWRFPADLSITKTDSPDPQLTGGNVTYTLTATNNGPYDASGVTITDILPAGLTFVSATPSQGTCAGTTTVTCTLGSLANGVSATVTIVVTARTGGTISNTAVVTAQQVDPNPANNSATQNTSIVTATPTLTPTVTPTVTLTPTATPTCILGDINCDGIVDIRDYGIWRQNFGQTACGNPADLNGDCIVDIRDYGIWRTNFGHTSGAAARTTTPVAASRLGAATPTPLRGRSAASGESGPVWGVLRQVAQALGITPRRHVARLAPDIIG